MTKNSSRKRSVKSRRVASKKNTPMHKRLYASIKKEAKKKFEVYPSFYANAWLTRTYKKRGGKYTSRKV